jgi:hypothetical protein
VRQFVNLQGASTAGRLLLGGRAATLRASCRRLPPAGAARPPEVPAGQLDIKCRTFAEENQAIPMRPPIVGVGELEHDGQVHSWDGSEDHVEVGPAEPLLQQLRPQDLVPCGVSRLVPPRRLVGHHGQ